MGDSWGGAAINACESMFSSSILSSSSHVWASSGIPLGFHCPILPMRTIRAEGVTPTLSTSGQTGSGLQLAIIRADVIWGPHSDFEE
jgi:hypothetical protein